MDEDWDAEIAAESGNKPRATAQIPTYSASSRNDQALYDSSSSSSSNNWKNSEWPTNSSSSSNPFSAGYGSRGRGGFGSYSGNRDRRTDSPSSGAARSYRGGDERDSARDFSRGRDNNYSSEQQRGGGGDRVDQVDYIEIDARCTSAVIGRQGATVSNIRDRCGVRIDVPRREDIGDSRTVRIKISGSSSEGVDKAKTMIQQVVDENNNNRGSGGFGGGFGNGGGGYRQSREHETSNMKRDLSRPFSNDRDSKRSYNDQWGDNNKNESSSSSSFSSAFASSSKKNYNNHEENNNNSDSNKHESSSGGFGSIDWAAVRAQPLQNMNKFKDHPPVLKDFYVESPEVKAMTLEEVREFRKANFGIMVELFKKEDLTYGFGKYEEDKRTPEEIEAYLFENVPKPVRTIEQAFRSFPEILDECKRQNFRDPTPIQSQMWPILLKGLDCIGIAQTGTGKTLAFLLPALIHIDKQSTPRNERVGPNVLVLSPTRELAVQIEQEVKKINYMGIKSVCVYGGVDRREQINVCTQGVEIIIATPGRLYDLIQAGAVNVTSVTYLVMDEADRMLDMGFEPQIMKILLDIRPDRQTVMTSATWPPGVRRLATKYLLEPIQLYVGTLDLRAAKTVNQVIKLVQSEDEKKERLIEYITTKMDHSLDKLIVFVGRKSMADNLSCDLAMKNIQCQSIHGDREQQDREDALEDFKTGAVRILIATDVASRGIDVKDITCVLNYDFPRNIEEYVHRVGRTGRAGRTGTAVTFVTREDWKHAQELIDILKQGEQEVPNGLIEMAERYEAMKRRRAEEGGGFGGGGFGGRRGDGGGDGLFGGGDNDRGRRGGGGGRGRGGGGRGGRGGRSSGGGMGGFYF